MDKFQKAIILGSRDSAAYITIGYGLEHKAFHIPYVYDYIIKSCRKQAAVIQNHENAIIHYIGQGEARHRKYKKLKLGGCHVYDCSSV
jgi:hypothetical protein